MKFILNVCSPARLWRPVFVGITTLLMSIPCALAEGFTNISEIKDCRVIGGETERLLCYDTVVDGGVFNEQQLKQVQIDQFGSKAIKKPPAPAPTVALEPASAQTHKTTPPPKTTDISVDRLSVTIIKIQKSGVGIHYFKTSDGQVWKQQNAGGWGGGVPFDAVIKAGSFGSFTLINEGGKSTRVKRVK